MDTVIVALLALLAGAALAYVASGRRQPPEVAAVREELRLLGDRIAAESSGVAQRLEGIDVRMSGALTSNQSLAENIFETLGDLRSATATVAGQAREFAALQDVLRAPKARGGVGEAMLIELLRQVLPPQAFEAQHRFSTGATVDAVVRMRDRLVCIDAKFPLANFQRMCEAADEGERAGAERAFAADVDKHINDIARRYIVPDEGTLDFAVMYVPAEGVYAEVLRLSHRRRKLFETAIEARVVPMSPLTIYGFLQTVHYGLKGLSIEKSATAVLDFCGRLQQDMERFASQYEVLGRHLQNARLKYEEGERRLDHFRDKLEHVADLRADGEATPPALEAVGE